MYISQIYMTKESLQPSIQQRKLAQRILKQRFPTASIDITEIEFYMISHLHNVRCCKSDLVLTWRDAAPFLLLFSVYQIRPCFQQN